MSPTTGLSCASVMFSLSVIGSPGRRRLLSSRISGALAMERKADYPSLLKIIKSQSGNRGIRLSDGRRGSSCMVDESGAKLGFGAVRVQAVVNSGIDLLEIGRAHV